MSVDHIPEVTPARNNSKIPGGSKSGRGSFDWEGTLMRALLTHAFADVCGGWSHNRAFGLANNRKKFEEAYALFLDRVSDFEEFHTKWRGKASSSKALRENAIHRLYMMYYDNRTNTRRISSEHPEGGNDLLREQMRYLEKYWRDGRSRTVQQWINLLEKAISK